VSAARAVVIGGGVIGCAAALELRRRDWQVEVVERHGEVGHGSTSASCGIVRRYYSQPAMVALAHEGSRIWADWSDYLGPVDEDLAVFRRPGMLFILPRIDAGVRRVVASMRDVGVEVEVLDEPTLRRRFPFLDTGSRHPPRSSEDPLFLEPTGRRLEGAVFEPDAGYVVSPGLATHNLRVAAGRDGVVFRMGRRVAAVGEAGSALAVDLEDGARLEADAVLNAAGPHSGAVNRLAGVRLPLETRPLRREVHALRNPLYERGESLPIVGDLDGGGYLRPEAGGRDLIVGSTDPECDVLEWVDDPDEYPETIGEASRERQCLRMMQRLPELRLGPRRGVVGLYDVTVQDWYPIADRTDRPGYYVCIGTSGSSFKTAPVLGALMAELMTKGRDGVDTDVEPLQLELPRIGRRVDASFLSRHRPALASSATVMG
jgi:sarcosine oxidase subunit beta